MKSRRFSIAVVFALAMILITGYWLAPIVKTGAAAPVSAEDNPYKGKILLVSMDTQHSIVLEQVQVKKVGDSTFLVGKGGDEGHPGNWTKDHIAWVPTHHIDMILEFGSTEALKKAFKAYQERMPPVQIGVPGKTQTAPPSAPPPPGR